MTDHTTPPPRYVLWETPAQAYNRGLDCGESRPQDTDWYLWCCAWNYIWVKRNMLGRALSLLLTPVWLIVLAVMLILVIVVIPCWYVSERLLPRYPRIQAVLKADVTAWFDRVTTRKDYHG